MSFDIILFFVITHEPWVFFMDRTRFSESILELSKAEQRKQEIVQKACEDAAEIVKAAHAKVAEIIDEARQAAVGEQDRLLEEAREKLGLEEGKILGKAEKEAAGIRAKKLGKDVFEGIVSSVLGA